MTTTGTTTATAIVVVRPLELLGAGVDERVVVAEATESADELDVTDELLCVMLDTIELNREIDALAGATPVVEAVAAARGH
jgi:hypothetical protein